MERFGENAADLFCRVMRYEDISNKANKCIPCIEDSILMWDYFLDRCIADERILVNMITDSDVFDFVPPHILIRLSERDPRKKWQRILINGNPDLLELMSNPDISAVYMALQKDGTLIRHCKEQTKKMWSIALRENFTAIRYKHVIEDDDLNAIAAYISKRYHKQPSQLHLNWFFKDMSLSPSQQRKVAEKYGYDIISVLKNPEEDLLFISKMMQ